MEIALKFKSDTYKIDLENNAIIFGKSNYNKNEFVYNLLDAFNNKNNNMLINGNKVNNDDYNVFFIDEDNDFTTDFKFTKNNILKQLIYNDVSKKINNDKIVKYANEIFDTIDEKVNKLLDRKINNHSDNNLNLQIEIPDINSIIDKFTNIYIDDVLVNNSNVSKAMKRKLLYQLYFLDIKNHIDKINIVIINNFDVYLNIDETINILSNINSLSNDNCHFILTTSNNLFEYLNLNIFNVYKFSNKLLSLNLIDIAIKNYILIKEFNHSNSSNFNDFYLENEKLIIIDDIDKIKNDLFNKYDILLSKVLNSKNIKIVRKKPINVKDNFIVCEDKNLYILFEEICKYLLD